MPLNKQLFTALIPGLFLVSLFLFLSLPVSVNSQSYILEAKIGDTTVVGSQSNVRIPVYLMNATDSVSMFEIVIFKDRMDVFSFHDTVISEGCLTEDWEFLHTIFLGEGSIAIKVMGAADWPSTPGQQPAIPFPQYGEIPLFYLLADLVSENDSADGRTTLAISLDQITNFLIFDHAGELIGTEEVEIVDTNYFNCDYWDDSVNPPVCLSWTQVIGPVADSIDISVITMSQIDRTLTNVTSGLIDVSWHICGDCAGSDNLIDLADVTTLISYVYLEGTPPVGLWAANVNGSTSGLIDLADITRLIDKIYISKLPLNCYEQ